MFNLKVKLMLAVAVLIVGGVSAANAQLVNGTTLKFNVPTSFVLRDQGFLAGTYEVARIPGTVDSPTLLVLRGEHDVMVFDTLTARSAKVADNTELVFDTVAGINFLTEIRIKGDDIAIDVPKTRSQKQAIAKNSPAEHIVLTANIGL
jgi:hypothetical protein